MKPPFRLSLGKAAEMQRRGAVHFHAIVRLDGVDPDDHRGRPPTAGLSVDDLKDAIRHPPRSPMRPTGTSRPGRRLAHGWGDPDKGLDIRALTVGGDVDVTDGRSPRTSPSTPPSPPRDRLPVHPDQPGHRRTDRPCRRPHRHGSSPPAGDSGAPATHRSSVNPALTPHRPATRKPSPGGGCAAGHTCSASAVTSSPRPAATPPPSALYPPPASCSAVLPALTTATS